MSYYPPPLPPENDDSQQHHHRQQPLHHQASNRENIGWNNDNYNRLPQQHENQNYIMSSKKCNQYSQNDTMPDNYNNGRINSQQCDNYHDPNGRGGGNNSNPNNIVKRAAKRRVKHDLPGPAGNWFRQKRQQKSAAAAIKNKRHSNTRTTNHGDRTQSQSNTSTITIKDGESTAQDNVIKPINNSPLSNNDTKTKPQDEQLFHDHSSDLHECNAWNFMCTTLNRIVPPANLNLLLHHHIPTTSSTTTTTCAYTRYKTALRTCIPDNYALIHEIHEGRYDKCHLDKELHTHDLHVPIFIGYVASVQCHAHSDWTALLVDEMHSVAKYHGNSGNVGRGGVLCWIEERLVKQHANWIRPGVVWMVEGAKLALFASLDEEEEEDGRHDNHANSSNNNINNQNNGSVTTEMTMVDTSPSTNTSRGGGSIDRMILVGESSLVYAWTPEEASCTFTHQEFSDLMERRCDLGLLRGEELPDDDDDGKERVEEEVVAYDGDDVMTCESNNDGNDDNNIDDDDAALIVEKSKDQTAEIIDITVPTEAALAASEQVLEACSAANNDKPMHTESQKENVKCILQEATCELEDATKPPMNNLSNPYTKKNLSQVTPHEEIATILSDVGNDNRDHEVLNSSVLVQPKLSSRLSPIPAKGLNGMPETKGSSVDHAQSPQLQVTNRPDQQIQDDIANSFDDMLDEDSLNEVLHNNAEGKLDNIVNETKDKGNDSFDDMLDEDSLDITPCKKKDEIGGKLDSSKMNTPGVDSFDDMLDEDSLDVDTPNVGKLGVRTSTPGGDSFDDMLDDDSDDNIEAMFQTKGPQTESGNLYSPSQGNTILDKDDLADLGDEDDDDF